MTKVRDFGCIDPRGWLASVLICVLTACSGGGDPSGSNNTAPTAVSQSSPGNTPPDASATVSAPSAYSTQTVILDGSISTDGDGAIASFLWEQTAGPSIFLVNPESAQTEFAVPRLAGPETISLRLRVTDDDGATASRAFSILVGPAPVQLDVRIDGTSLPFTDDEPLPLIVVSATLEGKNVVPASLSWASDLQGSLVDSASIGQRSQMSLIEGEHKLTLRADFESLGVIEYEQVVSVLPRMRQVSEYLSTPGPGHTILIPVVLVTHVPTTDGKLLDTSEANDRYRPPELGNNSVADLIDYVDLLSERQKFMLEEMSRFRGYKIPSNDPFLGYQIIAHYVFYEPLPLTSIASSSDPSKLLVDYDALLSRIDGERLVNSEGVKEFWFNNYVNEKLQFWESNMSSPTGLDISKSDEDPNDLPIYDNTYVVYGISYHETQAEAVRKHGQQIERMLDYTDRRYSGTSELFWGGFVGVVGYPGPPMTPGRCGWSQQPPNTTIDYGYLDETKVLVDCEDWRPDGTGATVSVDSNYFFSLDYQWPGNSASIPKKAESQYYIWWGQNMPGDQNGIPYGATRLENWWRIIGDWDNAITNQIKLYEPVPASLPPDPAPPAPPDPAPPAPAPTPTVVKLMPLGDSITQGNSSHNSYRRPLWQRLQSNGYDVDFVGSRQFHDGGATAPNPDFDQDHEGHWGWRADRLAAALPGWLNRNPADILLVHAGTNDLGQGQSSTDVLNDLDDILTAARAHNPGVILLVAKLIPRRGDTQIDELNGRLDAWAASRTTSRSRIVVVDQNTGFSVNSDTYDGVHPNQSGEEKMASRWFNALRPLLN